MENNQVSDQAQEPVAQEKQQGTKEQFVNKADHERALKDMLKYKSAMKDLEAKLNDYDAKLKAAEEAELQAEGKKDELLQRYKDQVSQLEGKNKSLVDSFYTTKKHDAVLAECRKLGLTDAAEEDLSLIAFEGGDVERTDQGRVIVHGASDFAQELKKRKGHWFSSQQAPKINAGGARRDPEPSELTASYLYSLEKTDKKKFLELMPKYMAQRAKQ